MKKNSLIITIWKYFLIFSIFILVFLWITQVLFFSKYYRYSKLQDIKSVADTIQNNKSNSNLKSIINEISLQKEICIEILDDGALPLFTSAYRGKGCLIGTIENAYFKANFINSDKASDSYELVNKEFNNDIMMYAIKLSDEEYAFINTSIEPIESITYIIRRQLIIISIIIFILSFAISYYISKYISKPIINISKSSKLIGKEKINFNTNSNILELDELATSLNYTNEELLKTDELRRDLMANVSHDLKTPLTMIKAYAEACCDIHKNKPDKQKEDMDTIVSEVERLTTLVEDILVLSRMQSNIEELDLDEFDLVELIDNVLDTYKYLTEVENYNFKFIHKKKHVLINADKEKIKQVIYNLVNNAINYTGEDNSVKVRLLDQNDIIRVEITDTGKGIKDEDIPFIWDKYYKNKKKHKRNLVGTGLGLSIVKEILEVHGYSYGVNTKIDKGTTFYFEIKKELD